MDRHSLEKFEKQRRLLRIKRYESPGEGYTERFLAEFRERQRRELLKSSARSLLWERVLTRFPDIGRPRFVFAAACPAMAAVAVAGVLFLKRADSPENQPIVLRDLSSTPVVAPVSYSPELQMPEGDLPNPEAVGDSSSLDSIRMIIAEKPVLGDDF